MSLALGERLAALREAVEAAEGRLEDSDLAEARALLAKAGARGALSDATTVAIAGGTGSGKSSVFNALAGEEVSRTGVRRPTTATTHALVGDTVRGDTELLDWLGVTRRHHGAGLGADLRDLVLLDLTDHDSTATAHQREVDRLLQVVDLFVWVVDPQKYADAVLHEGYLRPYASHGAAMLVVLNKVDLLEAREHEACLADVRRLLAEEGLGDVPVLAASARTGAGIEELRGVLAQRAAERRAWAVRLSADVGVVVRRLAVHCTGQRGAPALEPSGAQRAALVNALAAAAGVPLVTQAVEQSVRERGTAATGWPVLRWLRWRPDPLRRLHLGPPARGDRTALPPAGGAQRAAVAAALRDLRHALGDELPDAWRDDLRHSLEECERSLGDVLDEALAGTDLDAERPSRWWSPFGGAQWLLMLLTLLGAAWLLGLAALGYLQLADLVPTPQWRGLPVPTLMLVGGLLASTLLALARRPIVAFEARQRAGRAEERMRARIAEVAERHVLEPARQVGVAARRFCEALARAERG